MQPTITEILRAIVANLEELILPQLEGDHAQSAGYCARMLLNHLIQRIRKEGPLLCADSREKREMLKSLSEVIETGLKGGDHPGLRALSIEVREGLERIPYTQRYVSIEELTAENDSLKTLVEAVIRVLHEHRDRLDTEVYDRLIESVRGQLRAQLCRELSLAQSAVSEDTGPDMHARYQTKSKPIYDGASRNFELSGTTDTKESL